MSQIFRTSFYVFIAYIATGCFIDDVSQITQPHIKEQRVQRTPKQILHTNPTAKPSIQSKSKQSSSPLQSHQQPSPNYDIEHLKPEIYFQQITGNNKLMDGNEEIYLKSKQKDGFQIIDIYDTQNNLRATLSFKNKIPEGISKAYNKGQLLREIPYKSGQIDGVMKTYKGNLYIEESYQNGKKHGPTKIYNSNTLIALKTYSNDVLNGESQEYSKNGELTLKATYQNGKKHGLFQGFSNNKLVYAQEYENDFLQGESRTYGENEVLKIQRFYKNGLLDGEEKIYEYPTKKLISSAIYKNGVLLEPYKNYIYDKNDKRMNAIYNLSDNKNASLPKDWQYEIFYTLKPLDDFFTNSLVLDSESFYIYRNGGKAFEKEQKNNQTIIKTYYQHSDPTKNQIESYIIITPQSTTGTSYSPKGLILSRFQYAKDSHIIWTYHNGILHTKSEKIPGKSIIQTYKNNRVESEIIWIETKNITIQKGFYPNQTLHFEHCYKDNVMIEGRIYDKNRKEIYGFSYFNEDEIFDIAFPQTAAIKRKKVMPK